MAVARVLITRPRSFAEDIGCDSPSTIASVSSNLARSSGLVTSTSAWFWPATTVIGTPVPAIAFASDAVVSTACSKESSVG